MTPIAALHTFARHYCEEQAQHWRNRYQTIGSNMRSVEGQSTYPRYLVLDAILAEVERMTPADFMFQADLLEWLLIAGEAAETMSTQNSAHKSGAPHRAMAEEREKFCSAVRQCAERAELNVAPLPFRRTLSGAESMDLWNRLQNRWSMNDHYWYPLNVVEVSDPMLVFDANSFHSADGPQALREALIAHRIQRIWELRELESERELEIDVRLFDGRYNMSEGYWTSGNMDWLVYASHENSITVAGEWLVEALVKAWPTWEEHL